MANSSAQGVQKFVHQKNGKTSAIDDNEDLKVNTPARRKSQSNAHAARNGRAATLRSHSGPRRTSRGGIYSTDASNADRTSASGSTQHAMQGKAHKPPTRVESSIVLEDGVDREVYETDSDDEGNELPHPHGLNDLANRRMTGDSYPATTTGEPSEVDVNDGTQLPHVHARGMQPPTGPLTVRGSGARGGMTAPIVTSSQPIMSPQVTKPVHASIMNEMSGGFSFGKPPTTQLNVSRTAAQAQQLVQLPSLASQSTQPAQPSHGSQHQVDKQLQYTSQQRALVNAPSAARQPAAEKQAFMQAPAKSGIPQESRQPLQDASNRYAESDARHFAPSPDLEQRARKSHTTTPNQQPPQSDLPQPSDNAYSEFDYQDGVDGQGHDGMDGRQDHFQDQQDEEQRLEDQQPDDQHFGDQRPEDQQPEEHNPGPLLDYSGAELYAKSYADIKGQSFDIDPHAKPFKLPPDLPADTLSDKLVSVMKMGQTPQGNPQAAFFQSMTAAEWEDSGDWFLDRFGELVAKLKNARTEKRKFARAFETEIEQRHDAVAKKQMLTAAALFEMKKSGGKVLDGTPKKQKKSTKSKK